MKVENVKVEEKVAEKVVVILEVEKAVTKEQQIVEDEKKSESLTEVKIENLKSASDEGAGDAGDDRLQWNRKSRGRSLAGGTAAH